MRASLPTRRCCARHSARSGAATSPPAAPTPDRVRTAGTNPGDAAGCYNRLASTVAGQVIENESLVSLPNWLPLAFAVGDGDSLDPARGELSEYCDRARDRDVITGVVGLDEFRTAYPDGEEPGITNNAYTNVMAVWVLRCARELLELLADWRRVELTESLGLRLKTVGRWEEITRKVFIPFHDDGVVSRFEGYEALSELDWGRYRERYGDIRQLGIASSTPKATA